MLVLVPPGQLTVRELEDFRKEFVDRGERIPGSSKLRLYDDMKVWLHDKPWMQYVDNFQFFSFDTERKLCIGCIRISLHFNVEGVLKHGYNLGASIRPTERGKGYGNQQLYLALQFMKDFGDGSCLLAADSDNVASISNIKACGGKWVFDRGDVSVFKIDL